MEFRINQSYFQVGYKLFCQVIYILLSSWWEYFTKIFPLFINKQFHKNNFSLASFKSKCILSCIFSSIWSIFLVDYFDSIFRNELSNINMGHFDSQKNKKLLAETGVWFSYIGIPICLPGSSFCLSQFSNIVLSL